MMAVGFLGLSETNYPTTWHKNSKDLFLNNHLTGYLFITDLLLLSKCLFLIILSFSLSVLLMHDFFMEQWNDNSIHNMWNSIAMYT